MSPRRPERCCGPAAPAPEPTRRATTVVGVSAPPPTRIDLPREPLERGTIPQRLLTEGRAVFELPRFVWQGPFLARRPRGHRRPVVVLPGFGTGDVTTLPLRGYLRALGYDVHGWGLGRNQGDVDGVVPTLLERVRNLAHTSGMPVALIGWSHGGVLARELARRAPEAVARVITFGTPVVGGAKYTAVAPLFRERGLDLDRIEREIAAHNAAHPIVVPITAIYSCEDAVVAWQACLDPDSPDVEHVEVGGSHAGLGINPDVFGLVADRLAATPRRPAEAHTS